MSGTHPYTGTIYSNDHTLLLGWCFAGFEGLLESKSRVFGTSCVVLILSFVSKGVYNRYLHPLRHFPGPFWASVTDFHKLYLLSSSDLTSLFLGQHKRYGKTSPPSFQLGVDTEDMLTAPPRVDRSHLSRYALVQRRRDDSNPLSSIF